MADEQDAPEVDEVDERGTEQDRDDAGQTGAREREQRRRDRGLDDGQDDDDPDAEHLGDAGKRALDRMKAEKKAQARELAEIKAELQKYRDKDKTETERLTESAQTATVRAEQAETSFKALQAALEHAPEGATLEHVRKCAKRIRGSSDEELEADAAELYELMDIRKAERPKPGSKPRERLRPGGTDPEEPVEETDPRKLAALIPRG
jgi:hypothetical protein